jgi:hypothetical protein
MKNSKGSAGIPGTIIFNVARGFVFERGHHAEKEMNMRFDAHRAISLSSPEHVTFCENLPRGLPKVKESVEEMNVLEAVQACLERLTKREARFLSQLFASPRCVMTQNGFEEAIVFRSRSKTVSHDSAGRDETVNSFFGRLNRKTKPLFVVQKNTTYTLYGVHFNPDVF